MNTDDYVIVMCPPYPEYKEQPEDQSLCELRDCPKCDGKMWLSEKKKGILMSYACLQKEIILACYNCITELAKKNREMFTGATRVHLS